MNVFRFGLRAASATIALAVFLSCGGAVAQDRLTETGARLTSVGVDPLRVSVARTIAVGGDAVTGSFVTAHTASGKALRRDHLGFWLPWDGRLSSMTDNRFPVTDGRIIFKTLKDENMSGELFPIRITLAYRTQTALKFGVFELQATGSGAGQ
jgi:hypothetical protein